LEANATKLTFAAYLPDQPMTYNRFFTLLGIFTLIAIVGASICHYFLPISYALPLTVATIVLFIVFCGGLFYLGKRTARAKNKMLFTNVFMGVTMLKMFACGGMIGAYAYLSSPENKLFVVPFFLSYMVYTLLEITFLVKLARETG
jgi:hypothetical protein